MDQKKIGLFLRKLRKEKNLTQEQESEIFGVSRRTVTRWETGVNMPDLNILVEIADYYDVDLRELFDGERKSERMDKELEKTVKQAAEYSSMEMEKSAKMVLIYLIVGIVSLVINQIILLQGIGDTFWDGVVEGVTAGFALAGLVMAILHVTGKLAKIDDFKKRREQKNERD